MEDKVEDTNGSSHGSSQEGSERSEPVRSRWTPKPEQILILESIFNSGMVNPAKEETVNIRKLLEQFGTVGDANVFYWFQNRRSRSRRRQRMIQAGLAVNFRTRTGVPPPGAIQCEPTSSSGYFASASASAPASTYASASSSSSSLPSLIGDVGDEDLFAISRQMGLPEMEQSPIGSSLLCPSDASNLDYQSGLITVFINGLPTEIPSGPLDLKAMFGLDSILVHSSGQPVPIDEYGISIHGLEMGENYFLVSDQLR